MCAVGSVVLNGISLSVTSWAVGTNTEGLSNVGMGLFKFCEDRCQTCRWMPGWTRESPSFPFPTTLEYIRFLPSPSHTLTPLPTGSSLFLFCADVDNSFMGDSTDLALVTRTRAASAMVVLSMLVTLIACTFLFFGLGRKPEPNPDFVEGGESDKFIYFWPVVRRAAFWQGVSGFLGLVAVCIFADIIVNLDNDFRFDRFDFGIGDGFGTWHWVGVGVSVRARARVKVRVRVRVTQV